MANFVVSNTNDSGAGSLRQAVEDANGAGGADTISFAAGLAGQTITLTSGDLALTDDVTINGDTNGDREADITISGNDASRIFKHDAGLSNHSTALRSLTMTNGYNAYQGGAIFVLGGTFSMTDCTVRDSSSGGTAGGIYLDYTIATISNSLIAGNTALGKGGGISNYGGNTTILNTTIDGNQAGGAGGGIYKNAYGVTQGSADVGDLVMVNCTVTNNTSAGGAGGLVAGGEDTIANTVIAGNLNAGNPLDVAGTLEIANNNVFGGTATVTSGTGNLFNIANTGLGALADNGGPVLTRAIVDFGSVLINAGSNAAAAGQGLTTDAAGAPRVQGGIVDVGAREAPLILVTTAADTVSAGDGVTSLREAVTLANANADANIIRFAANLAGSTITLNGTLSLIRDVVIDGDVNGDDKADITLSGGGTNRIFTQSGSGADVDLLSLTLINGYAGGVTHGGAILVTGGSLDIRDTTIENCVSTYKGGAIAAFGAARLRVVDSLIRGNVAPTNYGGGIYANASTVTLTNSTLFLNESGRNGGGLSAEGSTLTILNSTITNNRGGLEGANPALGGGLDSTNSTLTVTNSVVADNTSGTGFVENDVSGSVTTANGSVFGTFVTPGSGADNIFNAGGLSLSGLLDHGGTVLTRSPADGSILIGAGNAALLPADAHDLDRDGNFTEALPRDGRHGGRVVDGTLDVGAVERIIDETIGGTPFDDLILGGIGTDNLSGRGGDDTLDGGLGTDTMAGGTGNDTYTHEAGDIIAEAFNEGYDTVSTSATVFTLGANVERVNFTGAGNFVGTGNGLANRFQGGAGDDRFVDILGGADIFSGNAGIDSMDFRNSATAAILNFITGIHTGAALGDSYAGIEKFLGSLTAADRMSAGGTGRVVYAGFGGDDRLNGGVKNDQLLGGAGDDILKGNGDRDSLDGGTGNDTMTGGSGGDVFVFIDAAFGQDTITDYVDGLDSFKVFSAVADNISDFTITNNNTTSVTLTIGVNTITVNGAAAITITAADFAFF